MANNWRTEDELLVTAVASDWKATIAGDSRFDLEDFKQDLRVAYLQLKEKGKVTENDLRNKAWFILRHDYGYKGDEHVILKSPPKPSPVRELRIPLSQDGEEHSEEDLIEYIYSRHREQPQPTETTILRDSFWKWVEGLPEKDQTLIRALAETKKRKSSPDNWPPLDRKHYVTKDYRTIAKELGYSHPFSIQKRARVLLKKFLKQIGAENASDLRPLW